MSTNAIGRSFSVRDGGFLKNTGNLEELAGSEFLLAIGERALSGRGPVRIVSTERGFDLRVGPWGEGCGPPLCYENGSWGSAAEARDPLAGALSGSASVERPRTTGHTRSTVARRLARVVGCARRALSRHASYATLAPGRAR
jgi:hypothetical protein